MFSPRYRLITMIGALGFLAVSGSALLANPQWCEYDPRGGGEWTYNPPGSTSVQAINYANGSATYFVDDGAGWSWVGDYDRFGNLHEHLFFVDNELDHEGANEWDWDHSGAMTTSRSRSTAVLVVGGRPELSVSP